MRKRGPYDFPPKPENEGDQEGVTQPEQQSGEDLETADQGAVVPVQHQSPEYESSYRFFQTSQRHLSAQLEPPPFNLEPVASFTPTQCEPQSPFKQPSLHSTRPKSAPSSPFKKSSAHFTRTSSVPSIVFPNPSQSPGRTQSGSSSQSFVYPPRDPSTQVPLSPSYRTPLSGLSTQSFASNPELTYRIFQPSQHHSSARLEPPSPNLESASSFTSAQSGPSVPFSQSYQPFRGPQSAPSSPFKRSSPHFTRSPSAPSFLLPSPHQSQSSTPSESMTHLSVSTQSDESAHVPLSSSYRSPELYQSSESLRSSESHQSSQSSLPPESPTLSRPQQDYSFHQQSQAQSFNEQLQLSGQVQPLHSQQPQLQPYQDQPTLTQSQSYQQPQLYDQLQYFSTQELAAANVPGATGTAASSPASLSDPQLSMIEQFQLSGQPQALQSQQPHLQTYQPFQTHEPFQPYQQLQPPDRSQYFPTQQPTQAHLATATDAVAASASASASPQHRQRQYLPPLQLVVADSDTASASGQVASYTSPTKQGSMQNVPQSPSKKSQLYYEYKNQCNDCKKCFKTPQDLKNHKTSVHKMKSCNIEKCRFETNDEEMLKDHQVQVHVGQLDTRNIQVPDQGAARPDSPASSNPAPSPSLPSCDLDNVGTSKKYKCDIENCKSFFFSQSSLMLHMARSHPEKKCPECGFRGRVDEIYYKHIIKEHPNSVAAAEANAIQTYFSNPNPQPPVSTTAPNPSRHNLPPSQGQSSSTRTNQCPDCGEQKSSQAFLGIHKKTHSEFKCESCTTFYINAGGLDRHNRSVFHTSAGNLIINCQHCHANFESLPKFKAHCENFVMTASKYERTRCPICGKELVSARSLQHHYYIFGDEHFDDSKTWKRDRDDDSDRSGGGGGRQQLATK